MKFDETSKVQNSTRKTQSLAFVSIDDEEHDDRNARPSPDHSAPRSSPGAAPAAAKESNCRVGRSRPILCSTMANVTDPSAAWSRNAIYFLCLDPAGDPHRHRTDVGLSRSRRRNVARRHVARHLRGCIRMSA
jgi:hypothetical protein